jgi:hypothetical protein
MSETDNPTPADAATIETGPVPVETFSRDYVEGLRSEAAKYRNEKKDAVEAAKAEVTAEWEAKLAAKDVELTQLQSDSLGKDVTLYKLRTAIELGVPSDKLVAFAGVIQGDNEEDIKASAQSAKELFGGVRNNDPATDPTQGSGGRPVLALNSDALLQAVKTVVGA